ncbi:hypothetical protein DV515_00001959 [Chloebia gouldiae]|uniref:Uncharacterized protein n=1 Tax=Chloebia gouldiae TaxID=44316 RepID=A0A3L8SXP1_CHLGU|nr:hypothetical protein DV515_00001959 [Chloebia gouldiae]
MSRKPQAGSRPLPRSHRRVPKLPTRKHGEFEPREDIFCPLPLSRAFPAPGFPRGFRRALGTRLSSAEGGEAPSYPRGVALGDTWMQKQDKDLCAFVDFKACQMETAPSNTEILLLQKTKESYNPKYCRCFFQKAIAFRPQARLG